MGWVLGSQGMAGVATGRSWKHQSQAGLRPRCWRSPPPQAPFPDVVPGALEIDQRQLKAVAVIMSSTMMDAALGPMHTATESTLWIA